MRTSFEDAPDGRTQPLSCPRRPPADHARHVGASALRAVLEGHLPTLIVPARRPNPTGRAAERLTDRDKLVERASQRSRTRRLLWMEDTVHDVPLQRPAELAERSTSPRQSAGAAPSSGHPRPGRQQVRRPGACAGRPGHAGRRRAAGAAGAGAPDRRPAGRLPGPAGRGVAGRAVARDCCAATAGPPLDAVAVDDVPCRPCRAPGALDARRRRRGRLRPDERARRPRVRSLRAGARPRERETAGPLSASVRVDWSDRVVRLDQPRTAPTTEPLRTQLSLAEYLEVHGKFLLGFERGPGSPSPFGQAARRIARSIPQARPLLAATHRGQPDRPLRLNAREADFSAGRRRSSTTACWIGGAAPSVRAPACGRSSSCTGAGWKSTCSRSPTPPASSTTAPRACASGWSFDGGDAAPVREVANEIDFAGTAEGRATIASCKTGGHDVNGPLYELLTLAERAAGRSVVTVFAHDRHAGPPGPSASRRARRPDPGRDRGWPIRPSCSQALAERRADGHRRHRRTARHAHQPMRRRRQHLRTRAQSQRRSGSTGGAACIAHSSRTASVSTTTSRRQQPNPSLNLAARTGRPPPRTSSSW